MHTPLTPQAEAAHQQEILHQQIIVQQVEEQRRASYMEYREIWTARLHTRRQAGLHSSMKFCYSNFEKLQRKD